MEQGVACAPAPRARARSLSARPRPHARARPARGDVSAQYGGKDETCPLSTGGRTRRVHLVQGEGRDVSSEPVISGAAADAGVRAGLRGERGERGRQGTGHRRENGEGGGKGFELGFGRTSVSISETTIPARPARPVRPAMWRYEGVSCARREKQAFKDSGAPRLSSQGGGPRYPPDAPSPPLPRYERRPRLGTAPLRAQRRDFGRRRHLG